MKYFWWRVRYTFYMCHLTGKFWWRDLKFGWMCSGSDCIIYDDGETPKQAVDEEVSCWYE